MMKNSLTILQNGVQMLADCRTMQDAKKLADMADAAKIYAKRAKLGEEAIGYARTIQVDALTLLGNMLKKTKRAKGTDKGGRKKLDGSRAAPSNSAPPAPTLEELEITKKESSKAQKLADLAEQEVELHEAVRSGEKTMTQAQREVREEKREEKRKENRKKVKKSKALSELVGVFATIVLDPPWDWGDEKDVNQMGRAKPDYATMTREQLMALPVSKWTDKDCHIYCWVTNRSMPKVFTLMETWGFRYITLLTWPKPSFGLGNYFRGQTEHIAFGVKGSQQLKRKDASTLLPVWDRGKEHSSKPLELYSFIESCSPGPYLEVFGRGEPRKDWTMIGADAT